VNLRVASDLHRPAVSLVLPIYNEIETLPLLLPRLRMLIDEIDGTVEVIFVDDGSTDGSAAYVSEALQSEHRFRLIQLSRNFGHQIAITAGMDAAEGEAVVVMDSDLQDPPEVVHRLIEKWRQGYEIVYARRLCRDGESFFKRTTAHMFYRLLGLLTSVPIPTDVGDFRLVGRKALDTFRAMPEHHRFVRGMFSWMGFSQTAVDFERPNREMGETKYSLRKMMRLAAHAVTSFSDKPLRLALWSGLAISAAACVMGSLTVGGWVLGLKVVPGWTFTIVVVMFFSGFNLLMTGVVGLYVGGILAEVRRRPLYVVNERLGFDEAKHPSLALGHPGKTVEQRERGLH
jgi:glycosyltransferase involved in cell wall biosynthesis